MHLKDTLQRNSLSSIGIQMVGFSCNISYTILIQSGCKKKMEEFGFGKRIVMASQFYLLGAKCFTTATNAKPPKHCERNSRFHKILGIIGH